MAENTPKPTSRTNTVKKPTTTAKARTTARTTATKTTSKASTASSSEKGSNKVLLIITCILGLTTGFFGWQFGVKSSELTTATEVKEQALSEKDQIKSQFDAQLAELEAQNAQLTEENSGLKSNLKTEKNRNQRLSNENVDLNDKVSMGSVLSTYQLSVNGVKLGVGDKEKIKTKAKKIEKIRTCFTVSANKITQTGMKDVFVRVVGPDDKVLTDGGSNFNYKGKSIAYSVKDELDYQGETEDMCLRIKNPLGEFEEGTYRIEVYIDGNKIGEENLRLD